MFVGTSDSNGPALGWNLPAPDQGISSHIPIRRMRYFAIRLLSGFAAILIVGSTAMAQTKTPPDSSTKSTDLEHRVQSARRGGGLRAGQWHLNGDVATGVTTSSTPAVEGYVRTGLDLHLVLENSVGVWRQRQATSAGGGLFGGSASVSDNYVIPQFTSVVFYPFTAPTDRVEPFLRGGIGFALGVEDPQNGSGGVSLTPGFGTTGGAGVEWRATEALGIAISARYQWIRFFQQFGGLQTYQGPMLEAGITYRFQYR
jgi:opacity protein-like surface antigen